MSLCRREVSVARRGCEAAGEVIFKWSEAARGSVSMWMWGWAVARGREAAGVVVVGQRGLAARAPKMAAGGSEAAAKSKVCQKCM